MALLFVESMDQYGAAANLPAIRTKFEARTAGTSEEYATGGRFGGIRAVIRGAGFFEKFTDIKGTALTTDELYVGCWMRTNVPLSASLTSAGAAATLIEFRNDLATTKVHLLLRLTPIGRLALFRGTTEIATSSLILVPDRFYWLEMRVVCASSGRFVLRVDGADVIDFTGQTTNSATTNPAGVQGVRFLPGNAGTSTAEHTSFDDIVIWDNQTGWPNTFPIGPHRISALAPNAAGTTTAWTPSTGANWQAVDERVTAAYSESDFVSATTANSVDLYNMENLPTTALDVRTVVANIVGRGTETPKTIDVAVRSASTTVFTTATRDLGIFPAPTGTVAFASVADAGDIVTVGDGVNSVAYTFGGGGGQVAPGASATASATNLAAAINASRLSGALDVIATSSTSTVTLTNLRLFGGSIVETADVGANNVTVTNFSQTVNFNNMIRQISLPTNPVSASNWTSIDFNAAEFGLRLRN